MFFGILEMMMAISKKCDSYQLKSFKTSLSPLF